jgi:peroxiredoxin Q/BCP
VFTAAGYAVVGISPDKPAKLLKFVKDQSLRFDLLSDEDLSVHKAYGAYGFKKMYGREYEGVLRSTFVVDEKGVVELALYNVKATGHVDMLRTRLGL